MYNRISIVRNKCHADRNKFICVAVYTDLLNNFVWELVSHFTWNKHASYVVTVFKSPSEIYNNKKSNIRIFNTKIRVYIVLYSYY